MLGALRRLAGGVFGSAGASTLSNPQSWFTRWATGSPDGQPPVVNELTALNYPALYTCVSLIAGTIAALPCKVYRKRDDGGQDEVPGHPVSERLQLEYNPNTSALTGREAEVGHLLTWGNSYTQVVRSRGGDVVRLQPLGPDCVSPRVEGGELVYAVRERWTGKVLGELARDQVLHTPYFSFDSLLGMSPVRLARTAIRSGMAQDREAERFVTRGIRPPGAISMKGRFKTDAEAIAFRNKFLAVHASEDSALNVVILEDEAKWQDIGFNPEAAQLLESRKFARGEIAGLYHVPPHLSGDVEKTTSWGTGIEELNIGFVTYCLLPILKRVEQERTRKLFRRGRPDDRGLYVEHVLSGLLRGDALKRAQALQLLMQNGVISVNDWRRLEGFNPVPGGNVRYVPVNYRRVDADTGEDLDPEPAAEPPAQRPAPKALAAPETGE